MKALKTISPPIFALLFSKDPITMNTYTNNNQHINSMSCYGSDFDENIAYQEINITQEEIKVLEDLSQGFANASFPFK
ncbi:hypothetical protein LK994_05325 [Ferruginibacter lapsinanis]|uniref:hypothetical protein n=1 Tax=Ferruginibacter lapsinanis TaxID=563172 RepID=UPI001E404D09|nr:hypothetical protein [Ferruginibacter lapsinanis]UEG50893.1 hypothetical protein LK994_05325 [Ferruginibacter lapsinanis]